MNFFIFLIVTTLLMGCGAFSRAELAERAKVELLGKSKEDILGCAGVPVRTQYDENLEFMTYFSGGAYGDNGSVYSRYCEVTFILRDKVVEKVNYVGDTGGIFTKGHQCAFVFQSCLPE